MLDFKHSLTLYDRKTENATNSEQGCLLNFCKIVWWRIHCPEQESGTVMLCQKIKKGDLHVIVNIK